MTSTRCNPLVISGGTLARCGDWRSRGGKADGDQSGWRPWAKTLSAEVIVLVAGSRM
jgi:hypothetical protein